MNIRHNGRDFPTTPQRISYFGDVPSGSATPTVASRWIRVTDGQGSTDLFWKGRCMVCSHNVWYAPEETSAHHPLTDYLTTRNIFAERSDSDGVPYSICERCNERTTDDASLSPYVGGEDRAPIEWPPTIMEALQQRIEDARKKAGEWADARPAVPVEGAYVLPVDHELGRTLPRFGGFNDNGTVTVQSAEGSKTYPMDQVMVLIPAVHGAMHRNIVNISYASDRCQIGEIVHVHRWSGRNVFLVHPDTRRTMNLQANQVAVAAPMVNPDAESLEEKVARLEYEHARTKHLLHTRMVAEGTARQWCSEFDPILDSTGLKGRIGREVWEGTATIRWEREVSGEGSDVNVEPHLNVAGGWATLLPSSSITMTELKRVQQATSRQMLS